jgi:hypothetical protein
MSLKLHYDRIPHTRWRNWLRHRATSRKVAGSVPDGVNGIFHWHNPSGRTMAGSASNRNEDYGCFLGSKGGRCVGLTTLPPTCAGCLEIWAPRPPGTLWTCTRITFTINMELAELGLEGGVDPISLEMSSLASSVSMVMSLRFRQKGQNFLTVSASRTDF